MVEKLQFCEQKLRYLTQRVADLAPDSYSPDENNEVRRGSIPAVVFGTLLDGPSQTVLPARMEEAPGKSHGAAQPQVALGTAGCPPQGTSRWGTNPWACYTHLPSIN